MTEILLSARQPFSFHSVVHSHGWVQLTPFILDEQNGTLNYTLQLHSGRVFSLDIVEAPGGVRIITDDMLTEDEQNDLASKLTWMLGLDMDFSSFYEQARQEPKLSHVEGKAQGRVLRSATLFEDVIKTILTTNTLWAATKRMNNNIIDQFGAPLASNQSIRAFPTPETLASTTEEVLRTQTRLGYRAPYVLDVARVVADGDFDLESLKHSDLPTPDLRKRLLSLKGIGSYAAANLLMLLGRGDFLPIDSWAMKLVSHEWHSGEEIKPADVEEAFKTWGEWKGLAFWFWDWSYYHQENEENTA
jgi:3-methyladenine DNA glycosylase/8-oxoguanine DNA glycosylase